jgi:hypothetical protein
MGYHLSRRLFLRAAGVGLALPMLDAMLPAVARAQTAAQPGGGKPRRMLAIQTNMGILPRYFFPEEAGRDYKSTPYLDLLAEVRTGRDRRDRLRRGRYLRRHPRPRRGGLDQHRGGAAVVHARRPVCRAFG